MPNTIYITVQQRAALRPLCNGHVMVGTLGQHVHRANHRVFSIQGDYVERNTAVSLQKRGFVKATLERGATIEFEVTELGRSAFHDGRLSGRC